MQGNAKNATKKLNYKHSNQKEKKYSAIFLIKYKLIISKSK